MAATQRCVRKIFSWRASAWRASARRLFQTALKQSLCGWSVCAGQPDLRAEDGPEVRLDGSRLDQGDAAAVLSSASPLPFSVSFPSCCCCCPRVGQGDAAAVLSHLSLCLCRSPHAFSGLRPSAAAAAAAAAAAYGWVSPPPIPPILTWRACPGCGRLPTSRAADDDTAAHSVVGGSRDTCHHRGVRHQGWQGWRVRRPGLDQPAAAAAGEASTRDFVNR